MRFVYFTKPVDAQHGMLMLGDRNDNSSVPVFESALPMLASRHFAMLLNRTMNDREEQSDLAFSTPR